MHHLINTYSFFLCLVFNHKKTDACVSRSVIEKTHALLLSALNQVVIWEYIPSNPALRVTLPKYQLQERARCGLPAKRSGRWTPALTPC